jgi:hypothetical protein
MNSKNIMKRYTAVTTEENQINEEGFTEKDQLKRDKGDVM